MPCVLLIYEFLLCLCERRRVCLTASVYLALQEPLEGGTIGWRRLVPLLPCTGGLPAPRGVGRRVFRRVDCQRRRAHQHLDSAPHDQWARDS